MGVNDFYVLTLSQYIAIGTLLKSANCPSFTTVIDPELQGTNLQGPSDHWVDGHNNERRGSGGSSRRG